MTEISPVAEIPYLIFASTTALVMVVSEAVTRAFKPHHPTRLAITRRSGRSIANLIPFTNLNIIFAFSIIVIIGIVLVLDQAFPKFQERPFLLGIQMNVFLCCLLITNPEALERLGRRLKTWTREFQMPAMPMPGWLVGKRGRRVNMVGPSSDITPPSVVTTIVY